MSTTATPTSVAAPAPAAPAPVSAPAPPPATSTPASTPAAPPAAAQPPVTPAAAAPAAPVSGAPYDPKTSATPPKSTDYTDDQQGLADYVKANTEWSLAHPTEAEARRQAKVVAINGEEQGESAPEASVAAAVEAAQAGDQPKPAEAAPAAAATPALIDQWQTSAPELKAVFDAHPEIREGMMETARALESAKPVLDIVGTPEEAQFAVETAGQMVSLQTNWMLAADDPDMAKNAWAQTTEMFKVLDAEGKEVVDPATGKPQMAPDFKPFRAAAATDYISEYGTGRYDTTIAALEARLAGVYPSEDARAADATQLQDAKYAKAAYNFVMDDLGRATSTTTALPPLPANATPEQVAFQAKLEEQQKALQAQQGQQTTEGRRAAARAVDTAVQTEYEAGVNRSVDTFVAAMKERGEYLPDFVLTDKYVNPQTGKVTNLSAFNVRIYQALNAKIGNNPMHKAKLASLQSMGTNGKDARLAEITRLQNLYLPQIIQTEVKRIQDGIRASSNRPAVPPAQQIARVEPQSQGTVTPVAMNSTQIRSWAEGEAAKDPNYNLMTPRDQEALIISLSARKRIGG